jgi:hypothetical protein
VATQAWLDRTTTTKWDKTLWVGIFPIDGDASPASSAYTSSVSTAEFAGLEEFFAVEAGRFGVTTPRPVRVELYPSSRERPPLLEPRSSMFGRALWSLRLRWFARRAADVPGRAQSQIRVFVLYHDPQLAKSLSHSLGLQKGLVGVVNAFADREMRGANAVVIAHEILHTLGATDKYDPETNAPRYPDGFADPDQRPLYPQTATEIMAGRRALSASESEMPDSLRDVVVGPATAREIGWQHP